MTLLMYHVIAKLDCPVLPHTHTHARVCAHTHTFSKRQSPFLSHRKCDTTWMVKMMMVKMVRCNGDEGV